MKEELVLAFVQLLKDNEAEVRTAGAGQIPGWFSLAETLSSNEPSVQASQNLLKSTPYCLGFYPV